MKQAIMVLHFLSPEAPSQAVGLFNDIVTCEVKAASVERLFETEGLDVWATCVPYDAAPPTSPFPKRRKEHRIGG